MQETVGEINRGDESLGQAFTAKLTGVDKLVESLAVESPVYKDEPTLDPKTFTLLLNPHPQLQKIELQSLEDEIDDALNQTRSACVARLRFELGSEVSVVLSAE